MGCEICIAYYNLLLAFNFNEMWHIEKKGKKSKLLRICCCAFMDSQITYFSNEIY